jgi:aldehyde dehydrogenase (NAD+)
MKIQDDATLVRPIFDEMRSNLKTRETHSIAFRKKALESLIAGYEKLKPQFDEALTHDLGLNTFMSNFSAHSVTLGEIKDLLTHIDQWAKPQSIETPIGKYVFYLALGVASCAI